MIAELILSAVDAELHAEGLDSGFRYVDDYELGFSTRSEAENALAVMQRVMSKYELELNPKKTQIIEMPSNLDTHGIPELRRFPFDDDASESQMLEYFDRAFSLSRQFPDEPILRYAVSRLQPAHIHNAAASVTIDLLLQTAIADPTTLQHTYRILKGLSAAGASLPVGAISDACSEIVVRSAVADHANETLWAIWIPLIVRGSLSARALNLACAMEDNAIQVLLQFAAANGELAGSTTECVNDIETTFDKCQLVLAEYSGASP